MSKAKTVMGHDFMLWLNGKVIACSKSCKLSFKANTMDGDTKDDGDWDAKEIVSRGCTITNDALYSADKNRSTDLVFKDLFQMYLKNEPIKFSCGVAKNKNAGGLPEEGWKEPTEDFIMGNVLLLGLDLDATKGSKGSISASMESYGKVEYVDGTAV